MKRVARSTPVRAPVPWVLLICLSLTGLPSNGTAPVEPLEPPAQAPQGMIPPYEQRPPQWSCLLEDADLAGRPVDAAVLKPVPGVSIVDHNDVIALIGSAADPDLLLQNCRCVFAAEARCISTKLHDTVDPISYRWSLSGPGALLGPGHGNSNLYQPPQLQIGQRIEVQIRQEIADNNANDPPARIHYRIGIERLNQCEYQREVQIAIEGDMAAPADLLDSGCDCLPQASTAWLKEPAPIDAAIVAPAWAEAGRRYVVQAGGSDTDALPLSCSGACGGDARSLPRPDELSYLWTAERGSYPDHGGAAATNSHGTTAIYRAPDDPGLDRLYIDVRDSSAQGIDDPIRRKHELMVYKIDLDVDSDNTRKAHEDEQDDPERTDAEDQMEDHACRDGKVLAVNNGDYDHDDVPNLVDGIDKWGNAGADASGSFTPVLVQLLEPIDPDLAVARFTYSASDPQRITRTPRSEGGYDFHHAPGQLRLWSRDGSQARKPQGLDQGGDYLAPLTDYTVRDHFPAPISSRTWRFFLEGIEVSPQPGEQRILLEVDPDGPAGPVGWLQDAVRVTVIRNELTLAETMAASLPAFLTKTRPVIELEAVDAAAISVEEGGIARVHLKGQVRDKIADLIPGGRADITYVEHEGQRLLVRRDALEAVSKARPYAFKGNFEGDLQVVLQPGESEFLLETAPNVQGLRGSKIIQIQAAAAGSHSQQLVITAVRSFTPSPAGSTSVGTPPAGPATQPRPSATEQSGCFRAYLGRLHDAGGMRDELHLREARDKLSPLEPEGGAAAQFISIEPFIFVGRPATIEDDRIVVLDGRIDAQWRYQQLGNRWPVMDVDIDADSNGDELIDDQDDDIEDVVPGLTIPPNVDDDDGDGQADASDDQINGPADANDLVRIVLRRPAALAPEATAQAVLKKRGAGRIRIFRDDGASGREVLAPDKQESEDLWPQLAQGELTLLVEGVGEGGVQIELQLQTRQTHCADFLAARVPAFRLEVGLDDPDLDGEDNETGQSGWVEVPADHVAVDLQGNASRGTLNLFAHYYREDELDDAEPLPPRRIRWEVEAGPGNQGARVARLRDLQDPLGNPSLRLDDAQVIGGYSAVQLDFTCPHPCDGHTDAGGERWVYASDTFRVTAIAQTTEGRQLRQTMDIRIVPGDWLFQVSNPGAGYSAPAARKMDDATYAAGYQDHATQLLVGSDQQTTVTLALSDAYRNPLEPGRPMLISLHGTGFIGNFDPGADDPDPAQQLEVQVGADGLVTFQRTETHYGNCPWQPDRSMETGAHIAITDGERIQNALQSLVERSDPLPAPLGPVVFEAPLRTLTAEFFTPDLYRRDTREFVARVTRRRGADSVPLANVAVRFAVMNGGMLPADGTVYTDADGYARLTLTAQNAQVGPIRVLAFLGAEGLKLSGDAMRWITSGPTQLTGSDRVFAGNITQGRVRRVETLIEDGDSGLIGDGMIDVPVPAASTYTVRGDPGKVYQVEVRDEQAWQLAARYPFDDLGADGMTQEVIASRSASVRGALLDSVDRREGLASLRFDGASEVIIPGSVAVDMPGGLLMSFWFKPEDDAGGELLHRAGQYSVRAQRAGEGRGARFLVLRLHGLDSANQPSTFTLESKVAAALGQWNYVEVLYESNRVRLSIGTQADRLESEYQNVAGLRTVTLGESLFVGRSLRGRLDDLRFVKGGVAPPLVNVVGVTAGTLTTDANGQAQFQIVSSGRLDSNSYRPVAVNVLVTGSQSTGTRAYVMHDTTYAESMGVIKAMLVGTEGLGTDPGWVEWGAAWLSEMAPLFADMRTLGFEFYKAASGCDSVSALNISFAVAGLIADCATFGTAGTALRASKAVVKTAVRTFLKEFSRNAAMGALTHMSVAAFTEFINKQFLRAECAAQRDHPPQCDGRTGLPRWITQHSEAFMASLTAWSNDLTIRETVDGVLHGVDELFRWFKIYRDAGGSQVETMLRTVGEEVTQP